MIFDIKHFCFYLQNTKFIIETNHIPLKALLKFQDFMDQLAQLTLVLLSYNYTIVYKLGRLYSNIDALTYSKIIEPKPYLKIQDIIAKLHIMLYKQLLFIMVVDYCKAHHSTVNNNKFLLRFFKCFESNDQQ